jgi:hypothetical protein
MRKRHHGQWGYGHLGAVHRRHVGKYGYKWITRQQWIFVSVKLGIDRLVGIFLQWLGQHFRFRLYQWLRNQHRLWRQFIQRFGFRHVWRFRFCLRLCSAGHNDFERPDTVWELARVWAVCPLLQRLHVELLGRHLLNEIWRHVPIAQ